MNFLLDTNAVSEWVKPRPNPGVIRWMESADEDRVFLSVISLAELRYGVERLPSGARRVRLNIGCEMNCRSDSTAGFYPLVTRSPRRGAEPCRAARRMGRPIGAMDAFLSATAEVHRLTLVTRNVSDFPLLKSVVNPWA